MRRPAPPPRGSSQHSAGHPPQLIRCTSKMNSSSSVVLLHMSSDRNKFALILQHVQRINSKLSHEQILRQPQIPGTQKKQDILIGEEPPGRLDWWCSGRRGREIAFGNKYFFPARFLAVSYLGQNGTLDNTARARG